MTKRGKRKPAEKPITLQPLPFDEVVADILKVKPEPKEDKEPEKNKED